MSQTSSGGSAVPGHPGEGPAGGGSSLPRWWMALGAAFVVLGGLVAAVTDPLALPSGSWLAAYLVLVCGVPQFVLGHLISGHATPLRAWWLLASWNAGNAAVIIGTLVTSPYVVDVGGLLLLISLIAVLYSLLRAPAEGAVIGGVWRWLLIALMVVMIVSIPIGLVLAHLRS